MSRQRKKVDSSKLFSREVCAFCGTDDDDEVLYGKFYRCPKISLHCNCMFFASGLVQHGRRQSDGILGFLFRDIDKELDRGKKLPCSHCKKKGATIGCCVKKCKKNFHLPCGLKHHSLHQFFGSFLSFCQDHKPKQKDTVLNEEDLYCRICFSDLTLGEFKSSLYCPCCRSNWFHRNCLQKYALSAGLHFFKCPLCNNSSDFVEEMKVHGICIPEKDASWELEENAYHELLARPDCDAPVCLCVKGRKFSGNSLSGWTLLSCSDCGYHARHKNCENLDTKADSWKCAECKAFEEKRKVEKAAMLIPGKMQGDVNVNSVSEPSHSGNTSLLVLKPDPACVNDRSYFKNVNSRNKAESSSFALAVAESFFGKEQFFCKSFVVPIENNDNVITVERKTKKILPSIDDVIPDVEEHRESIDCKRELLNKSDNSCQYQSESNFDDHDDKVLLNNKPLNNLQPQTILFPFSMKHVTKTVDKKDMLAKRSGKKRKYPVPKSFKHDSECHHYSCIKRMFGLECHKYRV